MKLTGLRKRSVRTWRAARRFVLERAMTETYRLAVLEEHARSGAAPIRVLEPGLIVDAPAPVFFGGEGLCDLSGYVGEEPSPEISLVEMERVTAVGRTEFLLKDGTAFYPQVIDPRSDAFMMELEQRGSVDLAANRLRLFPRAKKLRVTAAISLLGQCNGNYAHWVTEVLARFVLADRIPELDGLPILVDHPVHEKLLDALDFINVKRRPLINVLPYQKVEVERLFYITPPSMTPPETREFFASGALAPARVEQFHFSRAALGELRERVVPMARDCLVQPRDPEARREQHFRTDRRIFLQRKAWSTGNGRLLRNADDVERALVDMGFEAIDIADYSFEGQVLTGAQAGIIVSPIGAALTNLVFRQPGCIVIIISPFYSGATFYYFANLMAALGHRLIFVLGPQTRHGGGTIYNRDFRVSISLLQEAVCHAIAIQHETKVKRA